MTGKRAKKKQSTINKIDKMLAVLLILTLTFIVTMIVVFCRYGATPDALIVGVFGLVGGECGILGWIKSSKEKRRDRKWELQDRKDRREHKEEDVCNG